MCHMGDIQQVPYWGPTNTGCHCTKCSCLGNLAPMICAPLILKMNTKILWAQTWGNDPGFCPLNFCRERKRKVNMPNINTKNQNYLYKCFNIEYHNSKVIHKNILKQLKLNFISKYCGYTPLILESHPVSTFLRLWNFNSFM